MRAFIPTSVKTSVKTSLSRPLPRPLQKLEAIDRASLCSLAIALWGYQTGLFMIAIPIILTLEARRIIHRRWEISLSDLQEAAKLSAALLAILFVVIATIKKSVFIYTLFQWLPVAGLPLLIAQIYGLGVSELLIEYFSGSEYFSSSGYVSSSSLQSAIGRSAANRHSVIDLYALYFGLCIAAASAADSDRFIFYIGATLLIGLLLWPLRPRRSHPILWLFIFCLSIGLGFAGHRQLAHTQKRLEAQVIAMMGDIASGAVNPDGNATRMGSVGRLKLSNSIAFRVAADGDAAAAQFPLLLQEATYNQYHLSSWSATNSLFSDVPPGSDEGDWVLGPASEQDATITLSTDLERGDGILTLPRGTSAIRQLPVEELQRNQYGAVQVDAKGNVAYKIQFQPDRRSLDARPTAADLQIPKADQAAIETVLAQLGLKEEEENSEQRRDESETVSKIAAYFQDFQYSLDLLRPDAATTAVSDFLLNTQAGHCEYFASATALLLRGAGIPARYAVGYSAHELSPLERQYIVRSRDAHAWTLVYLDERWQILDTTPPDWAAQEKAKSSPFQIIGDFFSFLGFQLSYRIRQLGDLGLKEVLMIVIPLFCYLLWRSVQVFQGQQKKAAEAADGEMESRYLASGLDSELYQIEAQLNAQGLERLPAESFLQWCDRIKIHLNATQNNTLKAALALHYRYRFDPNGLDEKERLRLRSLSTSWIKNSE